MICIDNIQRFFDCNPNFEYARNVSIALAKEFGYDNGIIDDVAIPWILGDLELAFYDNMEKDEKQISILADYLKKCHEEASSAPE